MRILLSNDDGVQAKGLQILAETLSDIAEIIVVAPDRNRSGASNSLTLEVPLRVRACQPNWFSVQGTPTDCVHFALNAHLDTLPDLVITGINHGANLGDDVVYSGTVAAAMEGALFGVPSLAVSLVGMTHFETAAALVRDFVLNMMNRPWPSLLLNLNVPDVPLSQVVGVDVARLGARHRSPAMIAQTDPRGEPIYWFGPQGACREDSTDTDFASIDRHFAVLTPIALDMTDHSSLTAWAQQLDRDSSES